MNHFHVQGLFSFLNNFGLHIFFRHIRRVHFFVCFVGLSSAETLTALLLQQSIWKFILAPAQYNSLCSPNGFYVQRFIFIFRTVLVFIYFSGISATFIFWCVLLWLSSAEIFIFNSLLSTQLSFRNIGEFENWFNDLALRYVPKLVPIIEPPAKISGGVTAMYNFCARVARFCLFTVREAAVYEVDWGVLHAGRQRAVSWGPNHASGDSGKWQM